DSIRPREHGGWKRQTERFRGLQVHNELEFRRLLDREICRLGALENPVDVVRQAPVRFGQEWAVRAERAALREDGPAGDHRYATLHGEVQDGRTVLDGKAIGEDRERLWRVARHRIQGGNELLQATGRHVSDSQPQPSPRLFRERALEMRAWML